MTEIGDRSAAISIKAQLRNAALARRDALSAEERIEKSLAAAETGSKLLQIPVRTIVSAFLPIRSEIDARPLMAHLASAGARLCLPVVLDRQTIVFRELVRGAPLVPTGFGTSGPDTSAPALDPQWMIMPLAAFDRNGNRIGYGAGHYDRAIARLREKGIEPQRIGLAFATQEVEPFQATENDVALDAVITEIGLKRFADVDSE